MNILMAVGSIFLLCTSIINIIPQKIKLYRLVLMAAIMLAVSCILLQFEEKYTIIPLLIIPIIVTNVGNKNYIKNSISIFIAVLLMIIVDFLSGNIFGLLTGNGKEEIRLDLLIYYQYILMTWVLLYLFSKIVGNYLKSKRLFDYDLKGKVSLIFAASLLLTLFIFYFNVHIDSKGEFHNEINLLKSLIFLVYFILIMFIFYIFYKNTVNELKINNNETNLLQLQEYTENLEKLYSDTRAFRHDYINILASMTVYINEKDMDGLEKYFNENIYPISEYMEKSNFKLASLKNILISELKGIIYVKAIRAQELGIDVTIDILDSIDRINIDIIDLTRVTGIMLDNAIEASQASENPYIKIAIIKGEKSITFIIINSYCGDIQIDKIFRKSYTTKGEGRGIGLSNVKNIFDKYTNVSLETIASNGEFQHIIDIQGGD